MIFKKKGLSEVVSTVLIILLTVVAVLILSSFIIPWVRSSLPGSTECSKYQNYFQIYEGGKFNCKIIPTDEFNNHIAGRQDYKYGLTIQGGNNDGDPANIKGIQFNFILDNGESSVTVKAIKGDAYSPLSNPRMIGDLYGGKIAIPGNKEVFSYYYESYNFSRVEIYPILNNDKVCSENDKIIIPNCPNGVTFP